MEWRWLRLYVDITSSKKIRRLPIAYRWIYVAILVMGRKSPEPGKLLIGEGDSPALIATVEDIADEAKAELQDVEGAIKALLDLNILVKESNGTLVIRTFEEKQRKSDTSADRVRRWRERKQEQARQETEETGEQGRNVSETLQETLHEQFRNDAEKEKEKEKEKEVEEGKKALPPDATFKERKTLGTFLEVPGYPFDGGLDLKYLREWAAKFPYTDILEEAEKWKTYLSTAKKQPKNIRLSFRNWLKKADGWARERGAGSEAAEVSLAETREKAQEKMRGRFVTLLSYYLDGEQRPKETLKKWYEIFSGEMEGRDPEQQKRYFKKVKERCMDRDNHDKDFTKLLEVDEVAAAV